MANAAFIETVSGSRSNLLQQNFRRLPWRQESGLLREVESTLTDGRPRGCEAHAVGDSEREIWLECGVAAIDYQGERCLLLIAHDVTARRAAKEEPSATRDGANAASSAKGAFLANMSHEMRTPMNAIVDISRLASEDDMPPRARDFIDKVYSPALCPRTFDGWVPEVIPAT